MPSLPAGRQGLKFFYFSTPGRAWSSVPGRETLTPSGDTRLSIGRNSLPEIFGEAVLLSAHLPLTLSSTSEVAEGDPMYTSEVDRVTLPTSKGDTEHASSCCGEVDIEFLSSFQLYSSVYLG